MPWSLFWTVAWQAVIGAIVLWMVIHIVGGALRAVLVPAEPPEADDEDLPAAKGHRIL